MQAPPPGCDRTVSFPAIIITCLCFLLIVVACRGEGSRDGTDSPRAESSLLVVPFETQGDSGGNWFGVGLAADVERLLSNEAAVAIHPWNSVLMSKHSGRASMSSDTTLLQLGREADVVLVLGGSLRRHGTRSELFLHLLRVSDGLTLWSGTYWREAAAMSSFPSEIAVEVTDAVRHAPPLRR